MNYPLIRPALPPVDRWSSLLEDTYVCRRFSNFGPLATRLEHLFEETWGGQFTACVLASSGTAALAAPLIAAGVRGPVLLPAFTFAATLSAVRMAGAEPVLVDVCPVSWTVSPETLARALAESGARAAVILRPFGLRTDLSAHARIARQQGALLVIDDAAGLGVTRDYPERDPGVYEAYSLHATKPFGIGEGGVVFAHRARAPALRRALNFGLPVEADRVPPLWGINGKMSEFQAAVGLAMAELFPAQLTHRRSLVARYAALMRRFPEVLCRDRPEDGAWQFFPLLLPTAAIADRFALETGLRNMEIRRYYAPSLSQLTDARQLHPCPVAESLAARMCCLPVYPDACDGEMAEMVAIVEASLLASTHRACA